MICDRSVIVVMDEDVTGELFGGYVNGVTDVGLEVAYKFIGCDSLFVGVEGYEGNDSF